ncbi:MAG: hypothetical protein RLY93_17655 [Sumerlaeia bacterium]
MYRNPEEDFHPYGREWIMAFEKAKREGWIETHEDPFDELLQKFDLWTMQRLPGYDLDPET